MKIRYLGRKKPFRKKLYKSAAMLAALAFSALFVKEATLKEYAEPAIGIVSGTVISVRDGDTAVVVNSENKRVKIRLYGIDSPELDQQYGRKAKNFLAERILKKSITVDVLDIDRYKRSVGRVYLGGLDINRIMVQEGYAWVYPQYCKIPEREQWEKLQKEAEGNKKGLWSGDSPIRPWVWRKKSS